MTGFGVDENRMLWKYEGETESASNQGCQSCRISNLQRHEIVRAGAYRQMPETVVRVREVTQKPPVEDQDAAISERLDRHVPDNVSLPELSPEAALPHLPLDVHDLLIRHPAHAARRNPDSQRSSSSWLVHRLT